MPKRRLVPRLKGRQIAVTLYLPQRQYWVLKSVSAGSGFSMQYLMRRALEQVLSDAFRQGLLSRGSLPGGKEPR